VSIVNGAEADLVDGASVSVKGRVAVDGTSVTASRIAFR
jgi:riboflavin synthase alpha subunit